MYFLDKNMEGSCGKVSKSLYCNINSEIAKKKFLMHELKIRVKAKSFIHRKI